MTAAPVEVTRPSARVALVRIARPDVRNALNQAVLQGLEQAIRAAANEPEVRAIVLTGSGTQAFSAGADLGELAGIDARAAQRTLQSGQRTMRLIEASPVPVIAAVNGLALGGGFELVLACSFAVLADSAQLGLPEAGLGLIPGYGGTQRLSRRVGVPVAIHLMITGEWITAARAYELGLTPVPPAPVGEVVDVAVRLGERIATRGPAAVAAILFASRHGLEGSLATGLELEAGYAAIAIASEEAREGVAAFLDKRSAVFADVDRPVDLR
ncbi:enoyl-CoA hydratase/isomerase family protein [Jatrophihabitans cynanchi]|uniref:Enoyl-CoA hydratase/isomerase family protein n=1 Tax=Jatrophihabitans cynanchi TaxID=2944128 RepID=A0ABY7K303_9ACTN|nr:enoyl-CoA hydratase/isomerase family protein [Jatrophihabitans sp. SB3-54]WAX58380.1 enoyl-CoA hydratase/isomerase family protein [Jatrophihabitans sp. SB3-54]